MIASLVRVPAPVTGAWPGRAERGVPARERRRSFTAAYKLRVLAAYDAAGPGEKSAILRREGLYSSHIADWRRTRDAGALAALARPRGRPAADARDEQIAQLRKEKALLEKELAKARLVMAVQSRTVGLLGDTLRGSGHRSEADAATDRAIAELAPRIGTRAACAAVGEPQANYYRRQRVGPPARSAPVPQAGSGGQSAGPGRARGDLQPVDRPVV
jgi:transposase